MDWEDEEVSFQNFLASVNNGVAIERITLSRRDWMKSFIMAFDTTGKPTIPMPVGDVTAPFILTLIQAASLIAGNPNGAQSPGAWHVLTPVKVSAGGTGAVAPTIVVAAPGAGKTREIIAFVMVDTDSIAGSYVIDWCGDPTGTPATTFPDWHTSPPVLPLKVAMGMMGGSMPLIHAQTLASNKSMGLNAMGAGSWPNLASMIFVMLERDV